MVFSIINSKVIYYLLFIIIIIYYYYYYLFTIVIFSIFIDLNYVNFGEFGVFFFGLTGISGVVGRWCTVVVAGGGWYPAYAAWRQLRGVWRVASGNACGHKKYSESPESVNQRLNRRLSRLDSRTISPKRCRAAWIFDCPARPPSQKVIHKC